jgi:hypothetical protein
MKFKAIIFVAFLSIISLKAQTEEYLATMRESITEMESAKTAEEFQDLSNKFIRIAEAEPKEWLPVYYASYSTIMQSFFVEDNKEKDKLLNSAMETINKADAISKDNSEIFVMKAFVLQMQISIDPMARGMKYGMESDKLITKAIELDPGNPRPYMLRGESQFYTPEQFGGGKAKAKANFEKAVERFKTFVPKSAIHPNWGKKEAEDMLEKCKP